MATYGGQFTLTVLLPPSRFWYWYIHRGFCAAHEPSILLPSTRRLHVRHWTADRNLRTHLPAGYPGRDEGVAPDVYPDGPVSRRTRPPEVLANRHFGHPGHTSRYILFSPSSCPVPVLLLVYHQCEPCGCSSHNCTGHHSAESLTGSTHQPSWRVRHGTLAGKDFTLTIQWQVFAVFSR